MTMYCHQCGKATETNDRDMAVCAEHGPQWALYRNAPIADALVVNGDKVLLVKRGVEPYKGSWAIPGGYQLMGEHPAAGALRELKEETGIEGVVTGMLGIYVLRTSPTESRQITTFLARKTGGTLKPGDDATDCRWFHIDDLPSPILPFHIQCLKDFKNKAPDFLEHTFDA